jgi:membrane-bound serine protease (ClpP class)
MPIPLVSRLISLVVLIASLLAVVATAAGAQPLPDAGADVRCPEPVGDPRTIEVLPLRGGFLDPPVAAQVTDILDLAESQASELVVLQYSSAAGVSADIEALLARVDASPVPVAVLVGPLGTGAQAGGSAGLLWLGAHVRALSADATVGPLRPADLADPQGVDEGGLTATLIDRAGGDPAIGARLLDEAVTPDALANAGLVTLTAQGLEPMLVELDGAVVRAGGRERELRIRACEVEVRFHSLGLVRRMLHAATTGPFVYLLLVLGLGMLLFELFQPGFGVAGIAGVVMGVIGAFGLTVLPVTWWAVALVVLGLILYALDTAVAGFGPITLAATAAFVVGSHGFYAADALMLNGWLIAATTATVAVFFVLVMTSLLRAQAGPEGVAVDDLVGRPGIVRSVLNPEGHVYIDGALWRARWTGDARRAKVGTAVRVHAVDGAVLLVEPFDPEAASIPPAAR